MKKFIFLISRLSLLFKNKKEKKNFFHLKNSQRLHMWTEMNVKKRIQKPNRRNINSPRGWMEAEWTEDGGCMEDERAGKDVEWKSINICCCGGMEKKPDINKKKKDDRL